MSVGHNLIYSHLLECTRHLGVHSHYQWIASCWLAVYLNDWESNNLSLLDFNKSIHLCRVILLGLWWRYSDPKRHHCHMFSFQVATELIEYFKGFLGTGLSHWCICIFHDIDPLYFCVATIFVMAWIHHVLFYCHDLAYYTWIHSVLVGSHAMCLFIYACIFLPWWCYIYEDWFVLDCRYSTGSFPSNKYNILPIHFIKRFGNQYIFWIHTIGGICYTCIFYPLG